MRKYELSISADYVPEWGTTEAIREFFQNSIDEETRDPGNKMFFDYLGLSWLNGMSSMNQKILRTS